VQTADRQLDTASATLLRFSEMDFAVFYFVCSELKNKMHTVTTVLYGAKQTPTCSKCAPTTIHSPAVPFHLNGTQHRRIQFLKSGGFCSCSLRDSQVFFYPFSVTKLYPCSFVLYQYCDFYSIRKFTIHSEGKNYQLCREENLSFISLGERKRAVSLLDPIISR
jgi:hypothetical protein